MAINLVHWKRENLVGIDNTYRAEFTAVSQSGAFSLAQQDHIQ